MSEDIEITNGDVEMMNKEVTEEVTEEVTGEVDTGITDENGNAVQPVYGIRPCAYCGNVDPKKFRLLKVKVHWSKGEYYQFSCKVCGSRGPHTKQPDKAIDAWQTQTRKGE